MQNIIKTLKAAIADCEATLETMEAPADDSTPEYEQGHRDALDYALGLIKKCDNKRTIKKAIRAFVRDNYGPAELSAPSWDVDALAQAINESITGK